MIGLIARHESATLLRSPSTWILAALLGGLFGYLFLQQLENFIVVQPELSLQDHAPGLAGFLCARFLAPLAVVFVLVGPMLAMRSFSDEYRQQTLALWQSSPVPSRALVLGKFLGVLLVLAMLVAMACLIPLSLLVFVPLDLGVLASSLLGLLLCAASAAAVGLYFSSLTRHALIALTAGLSLLGLLWLVGHAPLSGTWSAILQAISLSQHLGGFFQGYVRLADVGYFCITIALFVVLTIIRLDAARHGGR